MHEPQDPLGPRIETALTLRSVSRAPAMAVMERALIRLAMMRRLAPARRSLPGSDGLDAPGGIDVP